MSTARMTLSALWCDQGMAHMLQTFDTQDARAASAIVLIDFGAETMFKSRELKLAVAAPAVTAVINALIFQQEAGLTPTLDYVIISHQDTDHWSLLNYLMDAVDEIKLPMKVGTVIYGGADWGASASKTVTRLRGYGITDPAPLKVISDNASDYRDANGTLGQLLPLGDVTLRTLIANAPAAKKNKTASLRKNGTSAVIVIDFQSERMILPGDATWETLATANELLDAWDESPVQPVKVASVPHHGSLETMTPNNRGNDSSLEELVAFTGLTRPQAIIASAGYENSFKHPYRLILETFGKFTASNGLGEHDAVIYELSKKRNNDGDNLSGFVKTTYATNIYTTVLSLESPVKVANFLFTRNELGFFTEDFKFYGPCKAVISVPYTPVKVMRDERSKSVHDGDSDDASDELTITAGHSKFIVNTRQVPRQRAMKVPPRHVLVGSQTTTATQTALTSTR